MSTNSNEMTISPPTSCSPPYQRRRVLFHRAHSSPDCCSLPSLDTCAMGEQQQQPVAVSVAHDKETSFSVPVEKVSCYEYFEEPIKGGSEEDNVLLLQEHIHENNKKNGPLFTPLKSCLSAGQLQQLRSNQESSGELCSATLSPGALSPRTNQTTLKRKVSFGRICIREHPRALGDHPAVSSGPALALDWYKPNNGRTTEVSVEDYEQARLPVRKKTREQIRVPRHERQQILLNEAGVTFSQLTAFQGETAQLKKSRRLTTRWNTNNHMDDDDDDDDNNDDQPVLPSVVRMLQKVGQKLFLFHHHQQQRQQQAQEYSLQQKQLDDLMARAAAAERIRQQQQMAYWQEQEEQGEATNTQNKHDGHEGENETTVHPKRLPRSASEPYFLSLVSNSTDSEDALEF